MSLTVPSTLEEWAAAPSCQGQDEKFCPGLPAELLPGDEIGVVLHPGDGDAVSGLQCPPQRIRHPVDGVGGAGGELNLLRLGPEKVRHGGPGGLISGGALLTQGVNSPVDVAPAQLQRLHGFRHTPGQLGGGGIVQVDQRAAVHLFRQGGKGRAQRVNVKLHRGKTSSRLG